MTQRNNKGSTLVMVLIAVLILSLIALSSLTQSNTELGTARNFAQEKNAFYSADAGIQVGIREIRNAVASAFDPSSVTFTRTFGKYTFYSGSIDDGSAQTLKGFRGFKPPPPVGMSVEASGELGVVTLPWDLVVTAAANVGSRNQARKQLETIVVTMVSEY
jgi:hypothetical protein